MRVWEASWLNDKCQCINVENICRQCKATHNAPLNRSLTQWQAGLQEDLSCPGPFKATFKWRIELQSTFRTLRFARGFCMPLTRYWWRWSLRQRPSSAAPINICVTPLSCVSSSLAAFCETRVLARHHCDGDESTLEIDKKISACEPIHETTGCTLFCISRLRWNLSKSSTNVWTRVQSM